MDTHHRAFYISKYYQAHRSTTYEQTLPVEPKSRIGEWFEPPSLTSVFFDKEDLPNVVLPEDRTAVAVCCHRFVDHGADWAVQTLVCGVDQGIKAVLDIKGKSGGMNTLDLDGQNLHIVCTPPFPDGMGGRVFIGKDRTTKFRGSKLACLDVHYAQVQCERFRLWRYSE